jgi:hypothetical protein
VVTARARVFAVLLLAALVGCGTSDDGDDAAVDDTGDDAGEPFYNVIEREEIGATWACEKPAKCVEEYEAFLGLASAHAEPISRFELWGQIDDCERNRPRVLIDPEPPEALRAQLVDALDIGFLVDGINERPLFVTTIRRAETETYAEAELLLTDPYVGTFQGLLLLPKRADGPVPAVLAIHGHDDDAAAYRDRYHGAEYPAHGMAILMLTMRAMGLTLGQHEHRITRSLLTSGFDLIGLHVYEALLGLKVLRYLPAIDDTRIGLIGHSGGSSTSNLTVRVDPGIAAYVSDYAVDYCEWGTPWEPYHCETAPEVFPYHRLVSDFTTSATPVLDVPYGYDGAVDEVFRFFETHLGR